ncbi:hypothetical protein LEP48_13560 [Isoptericola sp. NEAU-Y5]|uniref:Integral membrane protein n=1 Tax=Isoptericola luteus TaxID=2879484 RepID=A0ABS7ZKQ6_9MICO|nr:hypothetical protein [Isoptericola sp. NEAU-Y5]MCA5894365.1 hypothetical protein [Isoptericola sp. NEAU-Y5]
MSAVTVTRDQRDAFAAQVHSCAVRKVFRTVTEGCVVLGLGFWAVFGLVMVVVPLVVHRSGGVMGGGVSYGAEYSARWFAFSLGMILFLLVLATHLAAGGTRRALFTGVLGASLVTGLLYGVLHALFLLAERGLFGALGWEWTSPDATAVTGTGFLVTVGTQGIVAAAYMLVAVAVATGYQAYGVWRGTVLVVPGLAMLGLVEAVVGSGGVADAVTANAPDLVIPTSLRLVGGLVLLALAALWLRWQLLGLRLRPAR